MKSFLTDYTNINLDNLTDYPFGELKNESAPGAGDGTLLDKNLLNDWYSLFSKVLNEASIFPNGNFDNETNGYQLYQAMFGTEWKEVGNDGGITNFINGAGTNTALPEGNNLRYRKINGGLYVHLEGWFNAASTAELVSFTMPDGYRPTGNMYVRFFFQDGSGNRLRIFSNGEVRVANLGGPLYINVMYSID